MSFTAEDFAALETRLRALGDEKYRQFNEALIPGKENLSYGVRVPQLRAVGRELCRGDWRAFLDSDAVRHSRSHEIVTLAGLVTAGAKCELEERLRRTAAFIPRVDNWATNDIVCATYRIRPAERVAWLSFLQPYLVCGEEFGERFAVILLMDQFLTDETYPAVLDACAAARCPGYYTKMAVAWALCTAFCKYRDAAWDFLSGTRGASLDDWTFNKAIQKCRESYRVSEADKALLQSRKR